MRRREETTEEGDEGGGYCHSLRPVDASARPSAMSHRAEAWSAENSTYKLTHSLSSFAP